LLAFLVSPSQGSLLQVDKSILDFSAVESAGPILKRLFRVTDPSVADDFRPAIRLRSHLHKLYALTIQASLSLFPSTFIFEEFCDLST
jgi:hypothetical protein